MPNAYFYERIAAIPPGSFICHAGGALAGSDMLVLRNERMDDDTLLFVVQHGNDVHSFRYHDSPDVRLLVRSERYQFLGW